jgi:hypothetical protein
MTRRMLACGLAAAVAAAAVPSTAAAHLHPFNPAAACAPGETGAGNEAAAFLTAPGVQDHWSITDLAPGVPGVQFIIQLSNPGEADQSSGEISDPFGGNPGVAVAPQHCH